MYLSFYGFQENPFNVAPDPRFLYLTPGHREALAHLLYGVREKKGFVVLTGEVGTGKTTLIQALVEDLDGRARVALVSNSALPFEGILEWMLEDFGIPGAGQSQTQQLLGLKRFLEERRRDDQLAVLVLDEAQNLDPSTLEKIRLLSNFETRGEKLLQILLVGQRELRARLELPELRQLKQRIGLRCNIPILTAEEVRGYIRTRLKIAGAPDLGLFTDRAVNRIARYAGGIPRLVNILCDQCLLIGYADQQRRIEAEAADEAVRYLEGKERPGRESSRQHGRPPFWWIRAALGGVLRLARGFRVV